MESSRNYSQLVRLKYVLQHSTLQNKETLYVNALNEINEKFPNTEAAAEVNCLIVEKKYNTFVNEKKSLSPIKSSLDEIIKKFPNSEGAAHAKNLLIQLEQKSLTTQIEKAIPVGDNILAHINYKNANTLNYKVVSINEQEYINSKNYDQLEARNSQFIKRKSVLEEMVKLPVENDFLQHSTEIKIISLPTGYYAVLFTNGDDFNSTKNPISINFI